MMPSRLRTRGLLQRLLDRLAACDGRPEVAHVAQEVEGLATGQDLLRLRPRDERREHRPPGRGGKQIFFVRTDY